MVSETISIERSLLNSEAFRRLSSTAKTVYFDFKMKCRVEEIKNKKGRKSSWRIKNNGELIYTYVEAMNKSPKITRPAFTRALDNLIEHGFIDVAHSGAGGRKGDKSMYAISHRWRKWGTNEFVEVIRQKDTRQGRGFAVYWKNKNR
ncbi:MAG: hypothetical protein PVG39_26350 [Desulfobacteraceae bacterium]|jgi:hypothetical protein